MFRIYPISRAVVLPILEVNLGVANITIFVEMELLVGHALRHAPPEVVLAAVFLVLVEIVDLLYLEPGRIKAIIGTHL